MQIYLQQQSVVQSSFGVVSALHYCVNMYLKLIINFVCIIVVSHFNIQTNAVKEFRYQNTANKLLCSFSSVYLIFTNRIWQSLKGRKGLS